MENGLRPLRLVEGYLPVEDHGLIGDGQSAALVARDGTVSWLCVPRFDSPALFCGLLDRERGGAFRIAPAGLVESRQYYHDDTGVLVTLLRTDTGLLAVTDALTLDEQTGTGGQLPSARGELIRLLRVLEGEVEVSLEIEPRGHAEGEVEVRRAGDGWRLRGTAWPGVTVELTASRPLSGTRSTWRLAAGEPVYARLGWHGGDESGWPEPERRVSDTVACWRQWATQIEYDGPQPELVRRSAITLKLLDHAGSGAIIAAPTSSLPEEIGGERNWDYRFTWVRDAAFSVHALRRVGLRSEAEQFLHWVLAAVDREGEPRILYDIDGHQPTAEQIDAGLSGYRGSAPVRWGNAAADQTQHDVYGEILDCAYQWVAGGGTLEPPVWDWLRRLAERARIKWLQPDHGIWEIRGPGRRFTYSVALCQVALDRAARMAQRLDLPGDRGGWAAEAAKIRQSLLDEAWDPRLGAITEHVGGGAPEAAGGLDSSVLALPLRRVVHSTHPKMVSTTRAVVDRLGAGDGLLYRYLPDVSPDGLAGHEGAFLLCSFWLVDNLARQGELDRAGELYESLCARANPVGLLPEQIDPGSGAFLGNFPQAFSHVGVIGSGLNLVRSARELAASPRSRP